MTKLNEKRKEEMKSEMKKSIQISIKEDESACTPFKIPKARRVSAEEVFYEITPNSLRQAFR